MFKIINMLFKVTRFVAILVLVTAVGVAATGSLGSSGTAMAQQDGAVPGQSLGTTNDADIWRAVRQGQEFTVSIPDKKAGIMIQSEGENWRNARNGPVTNFGGWMIIGMIIMLAAFFGLRGRIRIDSGFSGKQILRFGSLERIGHWLAAGSFVVLGLVGGKSGRIQWTAPVFRVYGLLRQAGA
jgi:formate dehydrogenase subunit gamma